MNNINIFGLTGSIAAGKSEAAGVLRELGAHIIDADLLAREAVEPGCVAYQALLDEFGNSVLEPDGTIARKKLGELVFADAAKRLKLEAIVHPEVRRLFLEKIQAIRTSNLPCIIYVVPLLFESKNQYPELSKVILISAPDALRLRRIMERDGCSRELAERKMAAQRPQQEKEKLADIVIYNDGTLEDFRSRIREVYRGLLNCRPART